MLLNRDALAEQVQNICKMLHAFLLSPRQGVSAAFFSLFNVITDGLAIMAGLV